ncbi:MAG: terminase small subunit, partial [Synergistales bacterium]|nr:terminase small subunit [Synergistales bacterium]
MEVVCLKDKNGLTPKQAAFVREYLIDKNATQAAIRAGYSPRTADRIGPELLGKTRVEAEVNRNLIKQQERTEV